MGVLFRRFFWASSHQLPPRQGPSLQLCPPRSSKTPCGKVQGRPIIQALVHPGALRLNLCRTIPDNRTGSLESCAEIHKLPGASRQKKWEEFLPDLVNNPDPDCTWSTIKSPTLWELQPQHRLQYQTPHLHQLPHCVPSLLFRTDQRCCCR